MADYVAPVVAYGDGVAVVPVEGLADKRDRLAAADGAGVVL